MRVNGVGLSNSCGIASVTTLRQASAVAVYNGLPPVSVWDSGFRAAVVRLLASGFAMAGAGKPETSQNAMENFGQFIAGASERAN